MLGMDGPLWECNVHDLTCHQLYDLVKELSIPVNQQPHFKAAHTMQGRLVVASNTFDQADFQRYIFSFFMFDILHLLSYIPVHVQL